MKYTTDRITTLIVFDSVEGMQGALDRDRLTWRMNRQHADQTHRRHQNLTFRRQEPLTFPETPIIERGATHRLRLTIALLPSFPCSKEYTENRPPPNSIFRMRIAACPA